jgi:hypothetical protein
MIPCSQLIMSGAGLLKLTPLSNYLTKIINYVLNHSQSNSANAHLGISIVSTQFGSMLILGDLD